MAIKATDGDTSVDHEMYAADFAAVRAASMHELLPLDASVALVAATRAIHAAWRAASDPDECSALAAAGTLAAHSAIDCLLHDWAVRQRPDLAAWRSGTTLMRAARFTAALDRSLPPYIADLCKVRHALGRGASAEERVVALDWMRGDGMERALLSVLAIESALGAAD